MKYFLVVFLMFMFASSGLGDTDHGKCAVKVSGLRFHKKWNPKKLQKALDRRGLDVVEVVFRLKKDMVVVEVYNGSDGFCADVKKVIQKRICRTAVIRRYPQGTPPEPLLKVENGE